MKDEAHGTHVHHRAPVRDLIDFYVRWPEHRPQIMNILNRDELTHDEKDIVKWLILLADKVGMKDIA